MTNARRDLSDLWVTYTLRSALLGGLVGYGRESSVHSFCPLPGKISSIRCCSSCWICAFFFTELLGRVASLNCLNRDAVFGFWFGYVRVFPVGIGTLGFVGTNSVAFGFKVGGLVVRFDRIVGGFTGVEISFFESGFFGLVCCWVGVCLHYPCVT